MAVGLKAFTFCKLTRKNYSRAVSCNVINGQTFETDSFTNLASSVIACLNKNIFNQKEHPICLLKERIIHFFYERFKNARGNPLFSVYDSLSPIVTPHQNFDSLLVPEDHASRSVVDCYYLNKDWLLRGHMTAHQSDLIKMGLNNFLMVGDVYRRDKIDSTHYPVFHQLDGVRLLAPEELFAEEDDGIQKFSVKKSEKSPRTEYLQAEYTEKATKKAEVELKSTLEGLTQDLFGNEIQYKWVDAYFPFTHPSWELEVMLKGNWVEMLGCGIIEHKILENGGCGDRIGWAFGLGLERLAMAYYSIPDIRFFWSKDSGFLHQFEGKTCFDKVTFKPFSSYPAAPFDLSFWVNESFHSNEFYDLVREHCGKIIEQVKLIDTYINPKTGRESRCYRLVYRSMEKTLTKSELKEVHQGLINKLVAKFNVEVR